MFYYVELTIFKGINQPRKELGIYNTYPQMLKKFTFHHFF